MSSQEHKQKIWNLIKPIKTGMLTTLHGEELRARPMHLVQDRYDDTLWFFTDLESEKAFEVEQDRDVCITFADSHKDTYVSMTGVARLTSDKALVEEFWNPFVAAWFPEGKGAPNVGLIEVKINKGEHWNSDSSQMVQFFKMAKANAKDETPDIGEHEKFGT
ncbi:pyridoxamine 5'-phosphate oxidase family protein [Marinobacter sp. 1Y8]